MSCMTYIIRVFHAKVNIIDAQFLIAPIPFMRVI